MKSILCIATCLIVNICLVLLVPSSGVVLAFSRVFLKFPRKLILALIGLF